MEDELPPGYELQPSPDGRLLFVIRNGVALRNPAQKGQRMGGPVWFHAVDRAHAVEYAREHHEAARNSAIIS